MTPPTVVLLHGLARTHRSMSWLRGRLERAGYPTWAETYPSRRRSLAALADAVAERLESQLPRTRLVAVTHSLGGLLVRHMAARVPFESVVMLAPPNQGSRLALTLRHNPLYRALYGPAGYEVGGPTDCPLPPRPCGIIAGTVSRSPGNPTSWVTAALRLLPPGEPSDGTLLVEETRLADAAFTTVAASHTWILRHPQIPALCHQFFTTHSFPRSE